MDSPPPAPILILDDDTAHAESVRSLLAAGGLAAETCASPLQALPRLLRGDYPVLILDLDMPELNGLGVLEQLQQAGADVKVIVLSGETQVGSVAPVLRLGALDYLPKPSDPQQLLTTVANALSRSRLEQENRAIAARARADQALHEFMLDAFPDPVFLLNPDGTFRFVNRRFRAVFVADREPVGTAWQAVLGAEFTTLLKHRFDERRTGSRATRHFEFRHRCADGTERYFDLAATGLYEAGAEPDSRSFIGTYGVLRDLTEQRDAEAHRLELQTRLQQTSKMEAIGQITGGIAHDFNNILASIVGYAELVRNAHARLSREQLESYLNEVIHAGHRARDLIAQMLAFARSSRGAPQAVDVAAALQDVSRMLRAAIPAAIDLRTDFGADPEPVYADPAQLQQILINLLVNARDAIDGRGVIEVTLRRGTQAQHCAACGGRIEGEHMVLAVSDSGHGIPAEIRDQLFEMYFTTRAPGKGTGIGLWLVNRLVHEYEGHVTVDSAPGRGARFEIHFPPLGRAPQRLTAPAPDAARTGRVVLIDDEASVANFMSEILRDAGYEVVVFTESLAALRYLERHHHAVAAVLTDQQMPMLSGDAIAARIRELRADLPIALVSAFVAEASGEVAPFDRVLTKPFRIDELLQALEALLAGTPPGSPRGPDRR